MRALATALVLALLASAAVVEVRDWLGFPAKAVVCMAGRCVATNSSGVAVLPGAGHVDIYVDGVLAASSIEVGEGRKLVVLSQLVQLEIGPVPADGVLVVKGVRFLNGTVGDLAVPFNSSQLARPVSLMVNRPVEVRITRAAGWRLDAVAYRGMLWDMGTIDLVKVGLLTACKVSASGPVRSVAILANGSGVASGASEASALLPRGALKEAVIETDVVLPNGTRAVLRLTLPEGCTMHYRVNATLLTLRAVDSLGRQRGWKIRVGSVEGAGSLSLYVQPGLLYTVAVEAGFYNGTWQVAPSGDRLQLALPVPTAYIRLPIPARVVRVYGPVNATFYSAVEVEVPPGNYSVVAEVGSATYRWSVSLARGQVVELQPPRPATATTTPRPPEGTWQVSAALLAAASAVLAAAAAWGRYIKRGRGSAHGQG